MSRPYGITVLKNILLPPFARGKSYIKHHKSNIINHTSNMNKSLWQKILNIVITVLTAIATTFGVTSCMGV